MVTIREATVADVDTIHRLIIAIAEHHDQRQHVLTTPQRLREDGFGSSPRLGVLLAEAGPGDDREIAGYASFTWNYSIWLGQEFMNIDDVFVCERFRGLQVGQALMHRARQICRARGAPRLRWEVQADNEGAIRFYQRLGASMRAKGIFLWDATEG